MRAGGEGGVVELYRRTEVEYPKKMDQLGNIFYNIIGPLELISSDCNYDSKITLY